MLFGAKLLMCENLEKGQALCNCTEGSQEEIKTCISQKSLLNFQNFNVFFTMVGPLCFYQKTKGLTDTWIGKLISLKSKTTSAYEYGERITKTFLHSSPFFIQAVVPQLLPVPGFYDEFKTWQFMTYMCWALITLIPALRLGKWHLFKPIFIALLLEMLITTIYESWLGYLMLIFGLTDQKIAVIFRFIFLFDQIFKWEFFSRFFGIFRSAVNFVTAIIRNAVRAANNNIIVRLCGVIVQFV